MLLHQTTQKEYESLVSQPVQGLLLVAPTGTGKRYILEQLAQDIAGPHSAGRVIRIQPLEGKKSIGIEQIRELKASLKLAHAHPRVVLIPDAYLLTEEAQNSMLKILEEPPERVYFLLSARSLDDLLETIVSRVRVWRLLPVPGKDIQTYYSSYKPADVARAMTVADGRIGLIAALLQNETTHPLLLAIDHAKELLGATQFQRLCQVDSMTKDKQKEQLPLFIDALELVCKAAMEFAAKSGKVNAVATWKHRTAMVLEARDALSHNVQPKLVLTNLFLSL